MSFLALDGSSLTCAVLACATLSGCNDASNWSPEAYGLSEESMAALEEANVSATESQRLEALLEELFGTPHQPAFRDVEDAAMAATLMGGMAALDAEGRRLLEDENELRFEGLLEFVDAGELEAMVVSPSNPELWHRWDAFMEETGGADTPENLDRAELLILEDYPTLEMAGRKFQALCLHCHGTAGAGNGPTAEFLRPRPRNYHHGVFKRVSVERNRRPLREDLREILLNGIHGSAMPSFARLSRVGLEGLVDYVRFLSIRGETERMLVASVLVGETIDLKKARELRHLVWQRWQEAPEYVVLPAATTPPAATPERITRGRALFIDPDGGNCASCHGQDGRGDGSSSFKIDDRGRRVPAHRDEWGNTISPRDLTEGFYRFGSRPLDLFRRIHTGIGGGPMPGVGGITEADGSASLSEEDVWSLVHFVMSLSGD
jgi:mono/diheme cytochrome c family protein